MRGFVFQKCVQKMYEKHEKPYRKAAPLVADDNAHGFRPYSLILVNKGIRAIDCHVRATKGSD